jgi:hypothetical protein
MEYPVFSEASGQHHQYVRDVAVANLPLRRNPNDAAAIIAA